jgi:hypothetical protein
MAEDLRRGRNRSKFPNKETERMFEEFDRLGLSAEERRRRIIAKHLASTKK